MWELELIFNHLFKRSYVAVALKQDNESPDHESTEKMTAFRAAVFVWTSHSWAVGPNKVDVTSKHLQLQQEEGKQKQKERQEKKIFFLLLFNSTTLIHKKVKDIWLLAEI